MEQDFRIHEVADQTGLTHNYIYTCLKRMPEIFRGLVSTGQHNARIFSSGAVEILRRIVYLKSERMWSIAQIRDFLMRGGIAAEPWGAPGGTNGEVHGPNSPESGTRHGSQPNGVEARPVSLEALTSGLEAQRTGLEAMISGSAEAPKAGITETLNRTNGTENSFGVSALMGIIAEKDRMIGELYLALEEKERLVSDRDQEIGHRNRTIRELEIEIFEQRRRSDGIVMELTSQLSRLIGVGLSNPSPSQGAVCSEGPVFEAVRKADTFVGQTGEAGSDSAAAYSLGDEGTSVRPAEFPPGDAGWTGRRPPVSRSTGSVASAAKELNFEKRGARE